MTNSRVWVVEMYLPNARRWEPCAGFGLRRRDGTKALLEWRRANPDRRFRLTRYEAMIAPSSRP